MPVHWIYDIVLLVLFVYMLIRGWRQGILSTLLRVLGWAAAVFIILKYSAAWAGAIYTKFVEARIISTVESAIPAEAIAAMNSGAASVADLQNLLNSFSGMLSGYTIDTSTISQIQSLLSQNGTDLAAAITQTILQPILIGVIRGAVSLVVLIVCLIVFRLLAALTVKKDKKDKATMLSRTNQVLGLILAMCECLAVGFLAAYILSAAAPYINTDWLNTQALEQTYLLRIFML